MKSIASLQARLLNLARERGSRFQDLLNSLGAEQFLYRLSISPYAENFIFKGGTLLTYLTESNRKTRDLDFSIKDLDGDVNNLELKVSTTHRQPGEASWKRFASEKQTRAHENGIQETIFH